MATTTTNADNDYGDDFEVNYTVDDDDFGLSEDEDEEPPPTEPIFDYSENTNGLPTYQLRTSQHERFDEPDCQEIARLINATENIFLTSLPLCCLFSCIL